MYFRGINHHGQPVNPLKIPADSAESESKKSLLSPVLAPDLSPALEQTQDSLGSS